MLKLKERILQALRDYLKNKDYDEFRSELKGMDTPVKIVSNETKKSYTPDLVALHKGNKYLFEIEIADDPNEKELVEKCRALSAEAKKMEGKLNLVVPVENYGKVLQILNNNKLENIGILQINTH